MPLLFWILLLVPLLLALPLAYVVARRTFGPTAGTRRFRAVLPILLGGTVLPVLVLVLLFRFVPRNAWTNGFVVFNLGFVLFVCGLAGYMQYRTRQAGALLLDLGQPRSQRFFLIIGFLFLALAIVSGGLLLLDGDITIKDVSDILFRVAFGSFQVLLGTRRMQLREQGLLVSGDLLRWRKILGYHWEADRPNTLTLQVNTLQQMFTRPSLSIPPEHRDAVDRLLAQYVGRAPAVRRA